MTPTLFQITLGLFMVAVNIAFFVWFQRTRAADSAGRMTGMMARLGLDPGISARVDLKEAKDRCKRCRVEGFCERWLAGTAGGDNSFCPNAPVFANLA